MKGRDGVEEKEETDAMMLAGAGFGSGEGESRTGKNEGDGTSSWTGFGSGDKGGLCRAFGIRSSGIAAFRLEWGLTPQS